MHHQIHLLFLFFLFILFSLKSLFIAVLPIPTNDINEEYSATLFLYVHSLFSSFISANRHVKSKWYCFRAFAWHIVKLFNMLSTQYLTKFSNTLMITLWNLCSGQTISKMFKNSILSKKKKKLVISQLNVSFENNIVTKTKMFFYFYLFFTANLIPNLATLQNVDDISLLVFIRVPVICFHVQATFYKHFLSLFVVFCLSSDWPSVRSSVL